MLNQLCMRCPHIAEMPWLARNAGDSRFLCAVALNKAIFCRQCAEPAARAVIRQVRADEVNVSGRTGKVYGKACLVLAAAGLCHKLFCKCLALFFHCIIPNALLLCTRPPTRHRHNLTGRPSRAHTLGKQGRGRFLQQNIFCAQCGGKGRCPAPIWMLGIHQHKRAAACVGGRKRNAVHFSTPSSTSLVISSPKGRPAARIMPG